MKSLLTLLIVLGFTSVNAEQIMAGSDLLVSLNIPLITIDKELGIATAEVTETQKEIISHAAHEYGRCGGFNTVNVDEVSGDYKSLKTQKEKNEFYTFSSIIPYPSIVKKESILQSLDQLKKDNIKETIEFLSGFHTRNHKEKFPNEHVYQFQQKLDALLENSNQVYDVSLVTHQKTFQKTIRVRIVGEKRPDEIVVLGGHLDSTVNAFFGSNHRAPGADDNASGSANLFETLRVFAIGPRPERTVEFFWYAGEEGGLIGSDEIAKQYKQLNVDVVSVLQLDMTAFPADGEFTYNSVPDFTNAQLRDFLYELNDKYIGGTITEVKCGYGCSDHASWHKQGFPALFPAESAFFDFSNGRRVGKNKRIHKAEDVVGPFMSFEHSLMFSKIALSYALELSNSTQRF